MREDNGRIRFLSQSAPDEESRLRAAIADKYPQHLPDYLIALNTGARPSEQFSLTWRDIDLNRKLLTISRSKTGHSRHIPLNAVALMAFEGLLANSNGTGRVFANRGYKHWFDRAVADAGIENFTWYCLRHTFASRLVMAGVDLRTVAELMGHRTIQMTMRYAHLSPDHTLAAVRRMDEMFGPTATSTATSDFKGAESSRGRIN